MWTSNEISTKILTLCDQVILKKKKIVGESVKLLGRATGEKMD